MLAHKCSCSLLLCVRTETDSLPRWSYSLTSSIRPLYLCLSGFYEALHVLDVGGKCGCVLAASSLYSTYLCMNAPVQWEQRWKYKCSGDGRTCYCALCPPRVSAHLFFPSFFFFFNPKAFFSNVRVCFNAQKRAFWMLCECIFTKIPSNSWRFFFFFFFLIKLWVIARN